jgi:GNAT superfamily N-acetyltransferase
MSEDPKDALLAAVESLWPENTGFFRVPEDIENGKGQEIGAIVLEDHDEEDTLTLSLVKVRRGLEGLGFGTRILDKLCAMADEHCVALYIEIVPTGRLNEEQLVSWYEKRGFEAVDGYSYNREGPPMCRSPIPVASPEPE